MVERINWQIRLAEDAQQIRPVSRMAAEAYNAVSETMIAMVDRRLIEREDLDRLIGTNPIALMRANHRYHAGFMASVFRYSCFGLFSQVLVWVYRSYLHHGFSPDYFPIELAAWREAVAANLEPAQAAEIDAVYAWMRVRHDWIMQAAKQEGTPEIPADSECAALVQELLSGDYAAGVLRMQRHYQDVTTLAEFYQDQLQPALVQVGKMWETGRISAAEEHLATAVAERMLATAYVAMTSQLPETTQGSVVLATTPDETHAVGVRMIADLLELKGWEVHFLGVDLPIEDVAALVAKVRPNFVGISLVMPFNLRSTEQLVEQLRSACPDAPPRIMIGSRVLAWDRQLWRKLGADAYVPDLQTALLVAEAWR